MEKNADIQERIRVNSLHWESGPTLQVLTLYRDPSLGWVARAVKKGIISKNLQAINFQCFQFRVAAKRTWQSHHFKKHQLKLQ